MPVRIVTLRTEGSCRMPSDSAIVNGGLLRHLHVSSDPSQASNVIGKRFTKNVVGPARSNSAVTPALMPWMAAEMILFTDETPTVPVYAGYTPAETRRALKRKEEPSYMGTFSSARRYVMHTFANTQSALMKKRVSQYMLGADCPLCRGKRLRRESLSVKFAGYDIAEISSLALSRLADVVRPYAATQKQDERHPEKAIVTQRIACDLAARLEVLLELGLGYLSLERSIPKLSPGELKVCASLPGSIESVRCRQLPKTFAGWTGGTNVASGRN